MADTSPEAVSQTPVEPDVVQLPVVEQLKEERRIQDILYSIHAALSFYGLSNVAVTLRDTTIFVVSEIPGLCDSMLDMNRSQNALHAHGEISRICSASRMQCQFLHPIHMQWMNEEQVPAAVIEEVTQPQLPLQPVAVLRPA